MTGFKAVNRQCASSLQSVTDIAQSIQSGMIDIGVAAGVEHMTRNYGVRSSRPWDVARRGADASAALQTRAIPVDVSPFMKNSPVEEARDCLMPMGLTSEAVAEEFGFSREQQDAWVVRS